MFLNYTRYTYLECMTIIIGISKFSEVESCSSSSVIYGRTGDDATLKFQATTVNIENSALGFSNTIISPNGSSLFSVVYVNGNPVNIGACSGCTFTGDAATGNLSIRLDHLQPSNGGVYKQTVRMTTTNVKACITIYILGVPLKPVITASEYPAVGMSAVLRCNSTSTTTPGNHGLSLTFDWTIDSVNNPSDSRYSYSSNRHTVTISDVQKEEANKAFTCTATESVTNGYTSARSDVFTLNVIHGPDDIDISVKSPVTVTEGDAIANITCTADCYPGCSFSWKNETDNTTSSESGTLSLGTVNRYAAGSYTCIGRNTNDQFVHSLEGTIILIVNFPSTFSDAATVTSFYVKGKLDQDNVTVDEHDAEIQFKCTVDSKPAATTRIVFGGEVLKQMISNSMSLVHHDMACTDAGVYTCEGNNEIGLTSSSHLALFVNCSPRPYRHIQRNVTSSLSVPLTLSVTVVAFPEPGPKGFAWDKEDIVGWLPVLSNADLKISSAGLHSNLTLLNVTKNDFGHYRVTVSNVIGTYEQHLFVSEKIDQPQIQRDCNRTDYELTAIIVGSVFGVVCCILATYAAYLTILHRRIAKKENSSMGRLDRSRKQTPYRTPTIGSTPSERQSPSDAAASGNVQEYTELSNYENTGGEKSTYADLYEI